MVSKDDKQSSPSRLLGLTEIAGRWSTSRTTAQRALDQGGVRPLFLTGKKRGIRRYRESDVLAFERARQT